MGWFSKKKRNDPFEEFSKKMLGPAALAVSISEAVGSYMRGVKEGRSQYPACRREDPRLAQTWNDVRLEAFHRMFHFGAADLFLLADHQRQRELLSTLLSGGVRPGDAEHTGEPIEDTLRAISRVYSHLQASGSEVADSETDGYSLKQRGAHIMDGFVEAARALQAQWDEYSTAPSGFGPETLLDALWSDVSAKSKSIAMSAVFGPIPEDGMTFMLGEVAKHGSTQEVAAIKASFEIIRAAKQPEEIAPRPTSG